MQSWSPALKIRFNAGEEHSELISKLEQYSKIIEEQESRTRIEGLVAGLTLDEFQKDLKTLDKNDDSIYRYPIFLPLMGLEPSEISKLEDFIFN